MVENLWWGKAESYYNRNIKKSRSKQRKRDNM
jgi:hypothetical protein